MDLHPLKFHWNNILREMKTPTKYSKTLLNFIHCRTKMLQIWVPVLDFFQYVQFFMGLRKYFLMKLMKRQSRFFKAIWINLISITLKLLIKILNNCFMKINIMIAWLWTLPLVPKQILKFLNDFFKPHVTLQMDLYFWFIRKNSKDWIP